MAKGKCGGNKCADNLSCASSGSGSDCAAKCDPCRLSRIAEKSELQNLNDRLACYIDRARKLEIENNRLKIDLDNSKSDGNSDLNNVKDIYEDKICDCKKNIDEISCERSKLEMEVARLCEENEELRQHLEKALKDLYSAENRARLLDCKLTDTCQKLKATCAELKKCQDNVEYLKCEVERLKKQLEEARKNLEMETLNRVQADNNLCCCRDQMQRNDQVHDQEMKESNSSRQAEINEMNARLTTQYEAKLRQALHDLREQYEGQIRTNRCEIELIYENKIKALEKIAKHNACKASDCQDELQASRNCVCRLNDHVDELNLEINQLKNRVRELEVNAECERARFKNIIACLEAEIQKLRCEISRRIKEYQDLMDIKVSLDLEIAAYDKLLKGEESRLGECDLCDEEDEGKAAKAASCNQSSKKSCGGSKTCPSACAPSPPPCPPKCPPKCPQKSQKCPQQCPSKCPTKKTCPPKCPKPAPKCQQKRSPCGQSKKSSSSECSDSEMLFDEAIADVPASFLPLKRYSSSHSIGEIKRPRLLNNFDETEQKYFVIASTNGLVEIAEADPDGYFVKLKNKSNNEIDISGWTINRIIGKRQMSYTLEATTILEGNGCLSVWSTDSCVSHNPPRAIVMKGKKWMVDKLMQTILLDLKGEEQASSQRIKRVPSNRSSSCSGGGFGQDTLEICNRDTANFNEQYCVL